MKKLCDENDPVEFISLPDALDLAVTHHNISVTKPTAINWIRKHKLGHQPGGHKGAHWIVHRRRWLDFITGRWVNDYDGGSNSANKKNK